MIAIDTSALIAILRREDRATVCREVIGAASDGLLVDGLSLTVVPLSEDLAYAALRGYMAWGKGRHPAHLNIMDSFSYALAKDRDCPLLYIGNDFSRTDIRSALD